MCQNQIGTLSEKSIHSEIKNYLEPNKEYQEIKVGNETPFNIIVWSYNDCYLALVDQQNVVLLLL